MGKREADRLPVRVRDEDHQCATVTLAESTIPMELLPVEDYPTLPSVPDVFALVDGEKFTTETKRVLRAVGADDTLPMLTGMKIDVSSHGLTLAATDRYRLAVAHVHAGLLPDAVPAKGTLIDGATVRKVLPKLRSQDIRLGYGSDDHGALVSLESGPVTVITREHHNGEFANYRELLFTECAVTVVADRAELLKQIQRAAAVLSAKGEKAAPVIVSVDADAVTVAPSLKHQAGQVRTRALPAKVTGPGAGMAIAFTHQFLAEAVDSFTGETLTLNITEPTKPVLLTDTPDGLGDRTEFRHLVMPVRL